jgi:hypothetical protein
MFLQVMANSINHDLNLLVDEARYFAATLYAPYPGELKGGACLLPFCSQSFAILSHWRVFYVHIETSLRRAAKTLLCAARTSAAQCGEEGAVVQHRRRKVSPHPGNHLSGGRLERQLQVWLLGRDGSSLAPCLHAPAS